MKMKKRYSIGIGILLLLLGLFLWWTGRQDRQPTVALEKAQPVQQSTVSHPVTVAPTVPVSQDAYTLAAVTQLAQTDKLAAWYEMFHAPIDFWGKVVDEKGNPVVGAHVEYNVTDHPEQDGKPVTDTSDANGSFFLTGREGANLYIKVSKEGYYELPESARSLDYYRRGKADANLPTKDDPTIFVLKKKGGGAALIKVPSKYLALKGNGVANGIDLRKPKIVPGGQGDLVVECWVEGKEGDGQWNWRCRISAPGGGLIQRSDAFAFEAPAIEYKPSVEMTMQVNPNQWSETFSGDYYIKLSNGNYARAVLAVYARHQPALDISSTFINPAGSRNLEYDKAQQIKP